MQLTIDRRVWSPFSSEPPCANRLVVYLDERVAAPLEDSVAEIVQLVAPGGVS